MLFAKNGQEYADDFKNPCFQTAFEFLKRKDLKDLPAGTIQLENGVRASVQFYTSKDKNEKKYEAHNRYYDIQYVVKGMEYLYIARRDDAAVDTPYKAEGDCILYKDPAHETGILLQEGDLVTLAPDEIHKPGCMVDAPSDVMKIVIKVPVEQ